MANRQASTLSDGVTVIGAGIQVNGRVSGEEDLHVEGRLEGSVALTETFHVASGGVVMAEVKARDVVVSGVLVGNVTADDSVTLNPGGKLVGDIAAPRLIIADGAAFSGNISMGGEAPPRRERKSTSRARSGNRKRASGAGVPAAVKREDTVPAKTTAAPSRVAAIPVPQAPQTDDEVTVVVRHAAVESAEADAKKPAARAGKKSGKKKAPPRARVPKPGKRRVGRR